MNGFIDENGRALLSVDIRPESTSSAVAIEVWVDTGFTGDLVLPQNAIDPLGLDRSGSVDAILADGLLGVRAHNSLLELVAEEWLGRERLGTTFVYLCTLQPTTSAYCLISWLQHSIRGVWLALTQAGSPPARQPDLASPHVQRLVMPFLRFSDTQVATNFPREKIIDFPMSRNR